MLYQDALNGGLMTRRSWNGPAPFFLLLAALTAALAPSRMAAAGQDAAAIPFVPPMALSYSAEPSADQTSGEKKENGKKKRDKLKLHWRSASLDYGKKVRIDFRSKFRGETRASDAAVTQDVLDTLDIPRHRV